MVAKAIKDDQLAAPSQKKLRKVKPGQHRIIAVASQKGGTAKTTTTINLGIELAQLGNRVLLVDMDPQGHLAEGFGFSAPDLERDMSQVLERELEIAAVIIPISNNLDLAPANINLAQTENRLFSKARREDRLKQALETVHDRYDVFVIDCPPSLGILTVNAFSAADEVLVPMAAEFYSMLGVGQLMATVEEMRRELNPNLKVTGILPTRMNRTRHAQDVVDRVRAELPNVRIFSTPIPEAVVVKNASAAGQPLRVYAPSSPATKAYRSLAVEI